MRRDLFTEDHEAFRELARTFVEKEVVPHYPEWEKGGRLPRDVFKQMGALGMLGMAGLRSYEKLRGVSKQSVSERRCVLPLQCDRVHSRRRARNLPLQ